MRLSTRPRRVLLNLWMLKSKNGMYWYARDYLSRIGQPFTVIVRKGRLTQLIRELEDDGCAVLEVGGLGLAALAFHAIRKDWFVYTPTPHPLPLVRNQVVVVYDAYPFYARLGALKRLLFTLGVRTSRCMVAHINRSICLPFLASLPLGRVRLLFAPVVPPFVAPYDGRARDKAQCIVLGAFGTDSKKKNYEQLLAHDALRRGDVRLRLYGQDNGYTDALRKRFGDSSFELVSDISAGLDDFMSTIHAAVSVADGEGFGRPLASAIVSGMPCYLLESPAFREFFSGNACLYPTVDALLEGVARGDRVCSRSAQGFMSGTYAEAIEEAAESLRRMVQAPS